MPKKAKLGTHPKAVEAREKKASQKVEEQARKQKEAEDEYWRDESKALKRKEERKVSANHVVLQASITVVCRRHISTSSVYFTVQVCSAGS